MNRETAVRHAIHEMELAGLEFTAEELKMWDKIASGNCRLNMREKKQNDSLLKCANAFRKNSTTMSQANNAWLFIYEKPKVQRANANGKMNREMPAEMRSFSRNCEAILRNS